MSTLKNQKNAFMHKAATAGIKAGYSGKENTMFLTPFSIKPFGMNPDEFAEAEDKKLKSFIRICNLKGSGFYPFSIAKG
jgi:hypothetical protein